MNNATRLSYRPGGRPALRRARARSAGLPPIMLAALGAGLAFVLALALWPPAPAPMPSGSVLLVDESDSMPVGDAAYVEPILDALFGGVTYGSSIDVFIVGNNDQTGHLRIEIPSEGDNIAAYTQAHEKMKGARAAVKAFLDASARGPKANGTNIIDTLRRIAPGPGLKVMIASDGLEASSLVNLEATKVTDQNRRKIVARAAAGFPPDLLAQSKIQFVIPASAANSRCKYANDRRRLEGFWGAFFARVAPSSKLVSFDTTPVQWR